MPDSRYSAKKLYRPKWKIPLKAMQFAIVVGVSFLVAFVLVDESYSDKAYYTLALLFTAIGLWITEAAPPFVVSIIIMFCLFGGIENPYFWAESNIGTYIPVAKSSLWWLLIGGFFLSKGIQKARLDLDLVYFLTRFIGIRPRQILLAFMLTAAMLSMLLGSTATTVLMVASTLPFIKSLKERAPLSKAILIGIPAAAIIGSMGTIIGSASNAVAVGLLAGQGNELSFGGWMLQALAPAIFLTLLFWLFLITVFKTSTSQVELQKDIDPSNDLSKSRKIWVLSLSLGTIIFWLTAPWTHIPMSLVAGILVILFFVLRILKLKDVTSMPWDILFLVAGAIVLGMAISQAGLVGKFVNYFDIPAYSPTLIMLLFGWGCVFLSNFMSNTATTALLIPIGMAVLPEFALQVSVVIAISASCAIFLPISSPSNAVAFNTGFLKRRNFTVGGLLIGVAGPIVAVFWTTLMASI